MRCAVLQVSELGREVCNNLPVPYACNNMCSLLKGHSELTAVKGGRCSACKVAHYDDKACHRKHWPQHRALCKKLQAAEAAAAAAATDT